MAAPVSATLAAPPHTADLALRLAWCTTQRMTPRKYLMCTPSGSVATAGHNTFAAASFVAMPSPTRICMSQIGGSAPAPSAHVCPTVPRSTLSKDVHSVGAVLLARASMSMGMLCARS